MTQPGNRPRPKFRQLLSRCWQSFSRGWDWHLLAAGYGATFLLCGIAALWLPDMPEVFIRSHLTPPPLDGAPTAEHWFGLGPGRIDMMAPVLKSAGLSVWLSLLATLAGVIGGVLTATALHCVWRGGWLGDLASAATATPAVIAVLLLVSGWGAGFWTLVMILGACCAIPIAARCAEWYLEMDTRGDVLAARAMGWSRWRLAGDQFLTRIWRRSAASAAMLLPGVLLAEGTIGFIRDGGGDLRRIGHLIAAGRDHSLDAPWLLFWPGAVLGGLAMLLAAFAWAVRRTVDEPVHERLW